MFGVIWFWLQMKETVKENALLKAKLAASKDYMYNADFEQKADRDAVLRRLNENEWDQKSHSYITLDMESLKMV